MPHKPKSVPEEEYFKRLEAERTAALREELERERAEREAAELRELHFNRCGKCGSQMSPRLFKGIEIDICESCGAVLLDPGELQALAGEDRSDRVRTLTEFFLFARRPRSS